MNLFRNWVFYALASAFFAGLTALFGKLGVAGINSNMATLIRVVVIFVVTMTIVSIRSEWQRLDQLSARTWVFLVLSGIATGLSWLAYYRALQLGPVSRVAPIDKLSVVVAILLGVVVAGETLSWPVAIGGVLIVTGSIIMIAF